MVTVEKIGSPWFFQIFKINSLRKLLKGWLGYCEWHFDGNVLDASIQYIYIKPFFWKRILRHEYGHYYILFGIKSAEEGRARTKEYDKVTLHGLLQWRGKKLFEKYNITEQILKKLEETLS